MLTNLINIQQALIVRISELRKNTSLIQHSDLLNFSSIANGVLIVYASWSEQAIINCTETIIALYKQDYEGEIIVIDIDCMTTDFQFKIFGQICQGWGEIFTVHNGIITEKYLKKDSIAEYALSKI